MGVHGMDGKEGKNGGRDEQQDNNEDGNFASQGGKEVGFYFHFIHPFALRIIVLIISHLSHFSSSVENKFVPHLCSE
jgi:hypothetical protein